MVPPPVMLKSFEYFSMNSFLRLKLVVGGNVDLVIHKQSMDNEMLTLTLHEIALSLLTVK